MMFLNPFVQLPSCTTNVPYSTGAGKLIYAHRGGQTRQRVLKIKFEHW